MKKILWFILLTAALASCMVGPKYSRPDVKSPQAWNEQSPLLDTVATDTITNLKWFALFQDTILNKLINQALASNYDLGNAVLRIDQSRSVYGITKADLLPSFGYGAEASMNGQSRHNFSVGVSASWELDFWGKLRHSKRAAYAELLASQEGMKTIATTLISDVASYYFLLRDLDNRLAIAQRTVISRTEYYNLVNERFKGGDVSELDLLQADQQLSLAMATVQSLKRELNGVERSLNILLGEMPQAVPRGFENDAHTEFPAIPAGLPSDLLENRPDVKAAEYQLQAQTERIGVAVAMRFPTVSLTGMLGLANPDITTLFTPASFISNATATLLGPVFNFGKNKRRVDIQRQETEIAANNYAVTFISALGEVENAIVSVNTYADEYIARKRQAEAASKALMLSQQRYRQGFTDYLEVLIAETSMFDSELQASVVKGQQLTAYINLYRALGGGW